MIEAGSVLVARSHTRVAFLALLVMAAAWGSTFILIKDVVSRIPVVDLLAVRFAIASLALGIIVGPRIKISRDVLTKGACSACSTDQHRSCRRTASPTPRPVRQASSLACAGRRHTTDCSDPASSDRRRDLVGCPSGHDWARHSSLRGFTLGYGELLTVIAALLYARHIVALGHISTPQTAMSLSLVQLIVITPRVLQPPGGQRQDRVVPAFSYQKRATTGSSCSISRSSQAR